MNISVTGPQFDRHPDEPAPATIPVDIDSLKGKTREELHALGLRVWSKKQPMTSFERKMLAGRKRTTEGGTLWLFPHEWYDSIPNGTCIVDINFVEETFERGTSDDDKRFGCLAYGVMVETADE